MYKKAKLLGNTVSILLILIIFFVGCSKSTDVITQSPTSEIGTNSLPPIPSSAVTVTAVNGSTTQKLNTQISSSGENSGQITTSANCNGRILVTGSITGEVVDGNLMAEADMLYDNGTPVKDSSGNIVKATLTGKANQGNGNGKFTAHYSGIIDNGKLYITPGYNPAVNGLADTYNLILGWWNNTTVSLENWRNNDRNNWLFVLGEIKSSVGNGKFVTSIMPKIENSQLLNGSYIVNVTGNTFEGIFYASDGRVGKYQGTVTGGSINGIAWGRVGFQIAPDNTSHAFQMDGNFYGSGNLFLSGTVNCGSFNRNYIQVNVYGINDCRESNESNNGGTDSNTGNNGDNNSGNGNSQNNSGSNSGSGSDNETVEVENSGEGDSAGSVSGSPNCPDNIKKAISQALENRKDTVIYWNSHFKWQPEKVGLFVRYFPPKVNFRSPFRCIKLSFIGDNVKITYGWFSPSQKTVIPLISKGYSFVFPFNTSYIKDYETNAKRRILWHCAQFFFACAIILN